MLSHASSNIDRPDEFSNGRLPQHLEIYTFPSCTLAELTHLIADADPSIFPSPSVGTRLAYRLIYPDTRGGPASSPRLMVKELGSVVIGPSGAGAESEEVEDAGANLDGVAADAGASLHDATRTLADARFVVGDYISVAILPTLESGAVAPASAAKTGPGPASGQAEGARSRDGAPGFARRDRENGLGRGRGGRGAAAFGLGNRERRDDGVPMGEWRRGEQLPGAPSRGRARGGPRW